MVGDRPAERLAGAGVLERIVGRALRDPERLRSNPRARAIEDAHRDPEAVAVLTDPVLRRHPAVREEQLAGRRALDPHLRLDPPDLEPGRVRLDQEAADAAVRGLRVGLREHGVELRHARVRDEPLGAVEDVLVAVAACRRQHRRRVAPRPRLGQRVGRQPLPGGESRNVACFLLLRAVEVERDRAESLHREDQAGRRADLRQLLDRDEQHQRAGPGATVALLEREGKDLRLA